MPNNPLLEIMLQYMVILKYVILFKRNFEGK